MSKTGLALLFLAVLLTGCGGSLQGDASAGPNPGGGYYGAPNIDIGRIKSLGGGGPRFDSAPIGGSWPRTVM